MKTPLSYYSIFLLINLGVQIISADEPKIIIIGAGPAGIAAASKLLENGISDITILEAEDRIGGRVFTTKFGKKRLFSETKIFYNFLYYLCFIFLILILFENYF